MILNMEPVMIDILAVRVHCLFIYKVTGERMTLVLVLFVFTQLPVR